MTTTDDLAQRLKNLRPGESLEISGDLQPAQSVSDAPQPVFEPGLATRQTPGGKTTGAMYAVKPDGPSGLPAPMQGSDEFRGEKYPQAAQPPSNVHQHPDAGQTQARHAQPDSTVGD